jgi:hypothetical protein
MTDLSQPIEQLPVRCPLCGGVMAEVKEFPISIGPAQIVNICMKCFHRVAQEKIDVQNTPVE